MTETIEKTPQEINFERSREQAQENHEAQLEANEALVKPEDKDAVTELTAKPEAAESTNPEQVKLEEAEEAFEEAIEEAVEEETPSEEVTPEVPEVPETDVPTDETDGAPTEETPEVTESETDVPTDSPAES
jgi:hypothetical protein